MGYQKFFPFQSMRCEIIFLFLLVASTIGLEDVSTQKEKDLTARRTLVLERQAANGKVTEVKLQIGSATGCGGYGVEVNIEGGGSNCRTSEHGSFSAKANLTWKGPELGTCNDTPFNKDLSSLTFQFKTTPGDLEAFCPKILEIKLGDQLYKATSKDISTYKNHNTKEDKKTFTAFDWNAAPGKDESCRRPKTVLGHWQTEHGHNWCSGGTQTFQWIDCDADGIPDPTCSYGGEKYGGEFWIISSAEFCIPKGPDYQCKAATGTSCKRPITLSGHWQSYWCTGRTQTFQWIDCDADGIPDPTCSYDGEVYPGEFWIISSAKGCTPQGPNYLCKSKIQI